jgi:hypothetical protein
MGNLKLDLLNNLKNKKYYAEIELVRLAQEPNMNYESKIDNMIHLLGEITTINSNIGLAEQYFKEPVAEQQGFTQGQPLQQTGNVHQGQTHGE